MDKEKFTFFFDELGWLRKFCYVLSLNIINNDKTKLINLIFIKEI